MFFTDASVRTKEYDSMHVDLPDPHLVCLYYASDSDGDTYFSERMYGEPLAEYPINSTVSPVKVDAFSLMVYDIIQVAYPQRNLDS